MQHTSHLLMIKPVKFGFNGETAVNNAFQVEQSAHDTQEKALREFDNFVTLLHNHGMDVTVIDDTPDPHTPDSIFPNNWISFHEDGTLLLYPMFAKNRRLERKQHVIDAIQHNFRVSATIDLSGYENQDLFLEGTGSMVLDRDHHIAYACISPRTHPELLQQFCNRMNYLPIAFEAVDTQDHPIYHTNVMMCVADNYAVVCTESIRNETERSLVSGSLQTTGKEIIDISLGQMNHFAGNMLQVHNRDGQKYLVMSTQAYNSLNPVQRSAIERNNPILHSPLDTIETNGGGSARCMMAEVFLPGK